MKISVKDWFATITTLALGIPLVALFAGALIDGEARRKELPLRAMIGDESYDAIVHGHQPPEGYFGNDRLAPDFSLRDQHGRAWRLSEHRGKTIVMNFWSITCPPCVEEMPSLIALAETLSRRDDVELVTVTTDADWASISALFPNNSNVRVLFDADKAVTLGKYGTRMLPETWIIDGDGIIRARIDGARDWNSPIAKELIASVSR